MAHKFRSMHGIRYEPDEPNTSVDLVMLQTAQESLETVSRLNLGNPCTKTDVTRPASILPTNILPHTAAAALPSSVTNTTWCIPSVRVTGRRNDTHWTNHSNRTAIVALHLHHYTLLTPPRSRVFGSTAAVKFPPNLTQEALVQHTTTAYFGNRKH
uniref:Uncharacterized protein n=1 Tax=Anopheles culicifacies TaxID=139723 RepID=A0A182MH63_9DIPT